MQRKNVGEERGSTTGARNPSVSTWTRSSVILAVRTMLLAAGFTLLLWRIAESLLSRFGKSASGAGI